MTDPTAPIDSSERTAPTPPPPPDPVRYDSVRDRRAREKGLPGPYIAGGDDPELGRTLSEERRYVRWLVLMVVTIVTAGFVIGTLIALFGPTS